MGAPVSGSGHRGGAGEGEVVIAGRRNLRYRVQMKRSILKLAVRRETIRALTTLELAGAVGGDAVLVAPTETCKVNCTVSAVVKLLPGG